MRVLDYLVDEAVAAVERLVIDTVEVEVLLFVDGFELGPTRNGRDCGADRGCDDLIARGSRGVEDPLPIVVPLTRDIPVLAANRQGGNVGAFGNSRSCSRFRPTVLPPIVIQMASEWVTGTTLIESISRGDCAPSVVWAEGVGSVSGRGRRARFTRTINLVGLVSSIAEGIGSLRGRVGDAAIIEVTTTVAVAVATIYGSGVTDASPLPFSSTFRMMMVTSKSPAMLSVYPSWNETGRSVAKMICRLPSPVLNSRA